MRGTGRVAIAVIAAALVSAAFGVTALAAPGSGNGRGQASRTLIVGGPSSPKLFPSIPSKKDIEDLLTAVNPPAFVHLAQACGDVENVPQMRVLTFSSAKAADRAADRLRDRRGIDFVMHPHPARLASDGPGTPVGTADSAAAAGDIPFESEPLYGRQWYLHNTGQELPGQIHVGESNPPTYYKVKPGADVDAPGAWARGVTGKGVVIAVLDEGVNTNHPDLANNIWHNPGEAGTDAQGRDKRTNKVDDDQNGWVDDYTGWDVVGHDPENFDGWDHGTEVASVAAADGRNGAGMTGLAPDAKIMPIRFIADNSADELAEMNAIEGFAYAIRNGANIINNSWDFIFPVGAGDPLLDLAIDCAAAKGIFMSWAGGNEGPLTDFPAGFPTHANVIVAGGEAPDGCWISAFQWSPAVNDTLAPGWDILAASSHPTPGYKMVAGTSFSAPLVAGAAALAMEAKPGISPAELKRAFLVSGRAPYAQVYAKSLGFLNVPAVLDAAADPATKPDVKPFDLDQELACRHAKLPTADDVKHAVLTWYGVPGAFYHGNISGLPEPLQSLWDNRPDWPLPDDPTAP